MYVRKVVEGLPHRLNNLLDVHNKTFFYEAFVDSLNILNKACAQLLNLCMNHRGMFLLHSNHNKQQIIKENSFCYKQSTNHGKS